MSKIVKVSCLLLCAGKSERMKPDHKLLMKVNDLTVLKKTALEIVNAQFFEVIAVTGYESEMVKDELHGMPVHVIYNADFESGMHSSIKAGVKAMSAEADYFAVCLADQPLITHEDYNTIINTVGSHSTKKLFRPYFENKTGNPAVISATYKNEILNHEDNDKGCIYLFENHPEEIVKIQMPDHSTLVDVDTRELFQEVKFHLEKK